MIMKIITTIISSVLTIVLIWVSFEPKEIQTELIVKEVPIEVPITATVPEPKIEVKATSSKIETVVKTVIAQKVEKQTVVEPIIATTSPKITTTTNETVEADEVIIKEVATTTEPVKKEITVQWNEEITKTPDKWLRDNYEVKMKFYPISSDGRLLNISKCYAKITNYLGHITLREAKYEDMINFGTLSMMTTVDIKCTTVKDEFTYNKNLWILE